MNPIATISNMMTRLSPTRLLLLVFLGAIAAGTSLLYLPVATMPGMTVSFLDAFFTASSAVCVTGLIVVDTGSTFSIFGQLVILALIQIGGLGIMTFASIGIKLFGARLPITHQQALEDSFFQRSAAKEFSTTFTHILRIVISIELIGFLLMFVGMRTQLPTGEALYAAFFHTISAFCNAGFSIYADNLARFNLSPIVLTVIMLLIILGGLGHIVLRELYRKGCSFFNADVFRLSFHSRIVLLTAFALIVGGTVALLAGGVRGENGESAVAAALFQSVTARTAGFNTIPIGSIPLPALLFIIILMFIGGAPGSCAGGIKTTSFAIWMARVRSALLGNKDVALFGREIPQDLILRAVAVVGLATAWNATGVILLAFCIPPGFSLVDIAFEQISAFGTVGLTTGITTSLGTVGRLWLIVTMVVGRLGPLTMLLSFVTTTKPRIKYAEGRIMVG